MLEKSKLFLLQNPKNHLLIQAYERKAAKVRPELNFLLTKENIPEKLELIYEFNGSKNQIDYEVWNIKFLIETNKYQKVLVYKIIN